MTLYATLGGITFDGSTADGDGIIWCAEMIGGWHDGTPIDSSTLPLPYGDTITAVHERGRALTLTGSAWNSSGGRLGDLWFRAERSLKEAMRFEYLPGLLVVTEPEIALQAYVRRVTDRIRVRRRGKLNVAEFEVPLLAPDPRRYDTDTTTFSDLLIAGTGTTVTDSETTFGDRPTAPTFTIDGPAQDVTIVNNTADGRYVRWLGTLGAGDTMVIDMAARTITINGTAVTPSSDSRFWQLLPGVNSLTYNRTSGASDSTAVMTFRDAYS
jgi:hypothetical protein